VRVVDRAIFKKNKQFSLTTTLQGIRFFFFEKNKSATMRELVHIQGGQCGNQIGAKFWEVGAPRFYPYFSHNTSVSSTASRECLGFVSAALIILVSDEFETDVFHPVVIR
jgi:hypothetical protein